jgi:hypothetical protein
MAYKIIVSPRAQKEIENAIDYYALYSIDAPIRFSTVSSFSNIFYDRSHPKVGKRLWKSQDPKRNTDHTFKELYIF